MHNIMKEQQMSTKKPVILVADDDPAMLTLLSRVLEIEGYRLVTASDGATALNFAAKEKALSLVVLELEAAEQRSIEVCHRLRKFSNVPVIIVAAKYEDHDVTRAFDAGADDFITKPVSMSGFVARVKAILRRRGLLPGSGLST